MPVFKKITTVGKVFVSWRHNCQKMKKSVLIWMAALVCLFTIDATAAPEKKDPLKMYKAANLFAGGDYEGALKVYRQIYNSDKENQKDGELLFLMGRCFYLLNRYDEAATYLSQAYKYDPKADKELALMLGQSYQKNGNLDSAEIMGNAAIKLLDPAKVKGTAEERLVNQCKFAREQLAKPQNVTFRNLGTKINTDVIESNPSVSADGKLLIFTSRRDDTEGGKVDVNNNQYYEDIYIARIDSITKDWGQAEHIEGAVNSKGHDASSSISPDGKIIYFYRNVVNKGSGQIFFSKVNNNGKWGSPKELEKDVNSSYFETSGCVSADGKWFYFISERPYGGKGNGDIWRSPKIGKNEFGKPENLGEVINTEEDEISVYIHPDGKTIYFSSRGHDNNMGGYDIFKSTFENGKWSKPVNLGYPINTIGDERHFVLTTDGSKAYYSAVKPGGQGDLDIYEVDMSQYGVEKKADETPAYTGPPLSILKGKVIDSNTGQNLSVKIDVTDATGNVTSIESDESGDYFITIEAEKDYTISVNDANYKAFSEKVNLPKGDKSTFSQYKYIRLDAIKK